jgi:hypothetical protein
MYKATRSSQKQLLNLFLASHHCMRAFSWFFERSGFSRGDRHFTPKRRRARDLKR